MKRNRFLFFTAILLATVFTGCGSGNEKSSVVTDSIRETSIKYPLPKSEDSLFALLKITIDDTNKINVLNNLVFKLNNSNPDTALILGQQAITLAQKLSWKKGEANAWSNLGINYRHKSEFQKSLSCFNTAIDIVTSLEKTAPSSDSALLKMREATYYSGIGLVYTDEGDYPKALEELFKALKINEAQSDKKRIPITLGNIGNVYYFQKNFSTSLDYYSKALAMAEETNYKTEIARNLGNIGNIYFNKKDYPKALDYGLRATKMNEEMGNKINLSANLGNVGNVYAEQKDYENAYNYLFRGYQLCAQLKSTGGMSINLANIGVLYMRKGDYKKSFD